MQNNSFNKITYFSYKKFNNVPCKTYFFDSWSGYSHPVKLQNPLSYSETQDPTRSVYYEASFMDKDDAINLFIFLEKIELTRVFIPLKEDLAGNPKNHYYLVKFANNTANVGKKVDLSDTINHKEYLRIKFNENRKMELCELVRKIFSYSYEYRYDQKGLLKQVIIINSEGAKRVLDY